jgi:hypothetical protein
MDVGRKVNRGLPRHGSGGRSVDSPRSVRQFRPHPTDLRGLPPASPGGGRKCRGRLPQSRSIHSNPRQRGHFQGAHISNDTID